MKLTKKISKGFALCATLAVMALWGGVLTSCSNGSDDEGEVEEIDIDSLELTSIIEGIVDGEDVWGSGTKTVKENDGSYTVTGAGEGEGGWGGNIAAIPVQFSSGDLAGFSYIVAEVDISGFQLTDNPDAGPAIELKIADSADSADKTAIINATKLLKDGKILIIPLENVKADVLKEAVKIQLCFRGSGTVKIKDISKAKAKA